MPLAAADSKRWRPIQPTPKKPKRGNPEFGSR
jgi:hypothetical protein